MNSNFMDKRNIFYTLLIFMGIIIFVVIFLMYFITNHVNQIPTNIESKLIDMNSHPINKKYGSRKSLTSLDHTNLPQNVCNSINNATWTNNKCQCKPHYYGDRCQHEVYDDKYFAVGHLQDDANYKVIKHSKVDYKSFHDNSCSKLCDNTPYCTGFIYENKSCKLISGNVNVKSIDSITNSIGGEATLYLNNIHNLKFNDYVFLGKNHHSLKYWTAEYDEFKHIKKGKVYKINFNPKILYPNYPDVDGIYSTEHFREDMVNHIKKNPTNNIYIHKVNTPLNVPQKWTSMYVYYG
jgi:hypothetical protein